MYHNPVPRHKEQHDEVREYCMMCDDLIPVGFSLESVDEDEDIFECHFTAEASFDSNITEERFREHVGSIHHVTDGSYDYIETVSDEPEFDKEFDFIKGSFEVKIKGLSE